MTGYLMTLPAAVLLGGGFLGAGGLLLPRRPWSERFAAGAVAVSLAVAAAGWTGLLSTPVLWAAAAVALAAALPRPSRLLPRFAPWVPVAALVLLLPLAGMPQTARDAMNHHMYLPRIWLEAGSIHRPDWCPFFFYPYLTESLYAMLGGTLGFRPSGIVSLLGFVGAIAAVTEDAAEAAGRRASILAGLVLLSMPEAFRNASWAYSDSFLVLFSVLAVREAAGARPDPVRASLWASAAAMCKYNGLVVALPVLAVTAWRCRRDRAGLARALPVTVLLTSVWALPNLLETGNPVYPLLGGVFGSPAPLSERAQALLSDYSAYTSSIRSPFDLLLLPVATTLGGAWDDPRLFDGSAGPLVLLGVVLCAMAGRNRRRLVLPALVFLATVLLTYPAVRVRYLLPAFALAAVPAALGLESALAGRRATALASVALMAACVGWSASWVARLYASERPWETLQPDFLEKRLPYMSFYMDVDRQLQPTDTTLMVNMGNRAFYFPSYAMYDSHRFPLVLLEPLWAGADREDLARRLRAGGVGYLAMDMDMTQVNVTGELGSREMAEWRGFVAEDLEPLVSVGPYVLFRLVE